MGLRTAQRIAVVQFAAVVVLVVCMAVLSIGREPLFDTLLYGFLPLSLAAAGGLVVARHPRNPVGWLFCGLAGWGALAEVAEGVGLWGAEYGLPGGEMGEWVITWSWILDVTLWTLVILLFPDGRVVSRRWRAVPWLAVGGGVLALPGYAFSTSSDGVHPGYENPLAVGWPAIDVVFRIGTTLLVGALLAAVFSFLLRLRRSRGVERQQLKWFAAAAALAGIVLPLSFVFWGRSILIELVAALSLSALPVAAGIAILRHRLYDIDRILNRALVYALLTALLAAVYAGLVLLPAQAFSGTGNEPSWLVAAATLAVAALFTPARRRIQDAVDRRFNRRRYDAAETIEAFSARLRDEIDLDTLSAELVAVVQRTMQPTAVSSWLRPPPRAR